jgi:hypothetical protein
MAREYENTIGKTNVKTEKEDIQYIIFLFYIIFSLFPFPTFHVLNGFTQTPYVLFEVLLAPPM